MFARGCLIGSAFSILCWLLFALLFVFVADAQGQNTDGEITWSWTAPTTNEDGTPLTDLSGYVVHFGEVSRIGRCGERPQSKLADPCYAFEIQVSDPNQTTTTFTLTPTGTTTYYTSAVAYDNASPTNNVSRWSDEVSFTVTIDANPSVPTDLTVTCTFIAPNIICTTP